jgi:spectrin alpha
LNRRADELVDTGSHIDISQIRQKQKDLNEAWSRLRLGASSRQERLFGAHEIQRLNRDIDETCAWISEKESLLALDDLGKDLANVQALQRKHDAVERDLAALADKVEGLTREGERLVQSGQGEGREQLNAKLDELAEQWSKLRERANERKKRLQESYKLQSILSDHRDLMNWYNEMSAVMSTDEIAKDVSSAEALVERHSEYKSELESRDDSLNKTLKSGRDLLTSLSPQTAEGLPADLVADKLTQLENERQRLGELWRQKHQFLMQCLEFQLFMRDAEQADNWLTKQESFLANESLGESLDDVEALIKKNQDFEKSLLAQEEKV